MSVTILNGDFEIFFTDDTAGVSKGDKQIRWVGSGSTTYTLNQLYSAVQDVFDNDDAAGTPAGLYMDEGIPMSASTPTQYTIGEIETNDNEPWFIDPVSIQHLTGGALETSGWTRSPLVGDGTGNIGIVRVQCSSTGFNMTDSDVGDGCTDDTNSDSGTILYVDTTNFQVWIRPDTNAAADSFDTGSGTISADTSTNTVTYDAAATTGENEWANIFTIGTIADETNMYVYQDGSKISAWWADGHIDVLILVSDLGTLIDYGQLNVFARQYSQLYDHSIVDASSGGRIPVAITNSDDINNDTGYVLLNCSSGSGTFTVGEVIGNNASRASATALGVVTAVSGTTADPDLTVYYVGDLTTFSAAETITGYSSSASATIDTVGSDGPAAITALTITFGATSQDIGDGAGNQPYDVIVDFNSNSLADGYEYLKYVTRRQPTEADIDAGTQTVVGESYLAAGDIKISYTGETGGPFTEGENITVGGSQAGVLTSLVDNGTTGTMVIRDTRNNLIVDTATIDGETSGAQATVDGAPTSITVSKTSPFGTFAGGQFFGSRGVWITDYAGADANSFSLVDSNNVTRTPPETVPITVNGLVAGDRVSVFRTTGDNNTVDKAIYNLTSQGSGSGTIVVGTSILSDTPSSGFIRVVNLSGDGTEQRYEYTSWTGSTFTLSGTTDRAYDTSDTAYVPYIDVEASGASASVSVTYVSDRFVVSRIRRKGIIPFEVQGQVTSSGLSATAVRNYDSIVD